MIHPTPPGARRRAMTLVELLIALTVMAVISTAAFSILLAAANINRANSRQDSALWDADFAWHRLLANGQSRLTFVVPDVTNNTTRTLIYYCTGSAAPFTLVESDPRFNVGGTPTTVASNVQSFSVTIDNSVTEQFWVDLKIAPANAFPVRRHFCIDCRNF
jgi:prepilin-type N-terminal cleavage/methylation domain-containing protein